MGDQKPVGRATGRGRARLQQTASPLPEAQTLPLPTRGAPLQGAWARRPGVTPSTSAEAPAAQPVQQAVPGRASPAPGRGDGVAGRGDGAAGGLPQQHVVSRPEPSGGGGDTTSLGRGALRGRRVISHELLETRPANLKSKQATIGQPIELQANYFKLLSATDWCLYKYRVDFAPEEDRIFVRKGMLRNFREKLGAYIFDGTVLYTSHRLEQPMEVFAARQSDDEKIKITIRFVGDMVKGDEHYLQFFNILMRKGLEFLDLQLVGRNFFDARSKIEVPQYQLELWPGYDTSIRQHERGILMCAEITHKVMRQQTLFDILSECYKQDGSNYQDRFKSMVIGVTVLTDYNNNTYRVDDVDYSQSPSSSFTSKKGDSMTFMEYYYNRYQIKIKNKTQPLLISRNKARDRRAGGDEMVSLVPELCRSTGMTDKMRTDHTMMRELSKHTRLDPRGRISRLMNFNQRLRTEPRVAEEFTDWNLKLDSKLLSLPGHVLDVESIVFGNGRKVPAGKGADWTRDLKNQQLLLSTPLKEWVMVVPQKMVRECEGFVGQLQAAVRSMNFPIATPRNYTIMNDRPIDYTAALEEIMSVANPQLIMCILMNNRAERYSAIKKKCCVDRPVPTQCILAKTLGSKNLHSIATKIVVQMNCKIGGAPWSVVIPADGIMMVGFDVCHDTNVKGRDFGALVASLDRGMSRYFSAVSAHTTGEELSNDLAVNMVKALHKYREINKALPTRIVVYRDGVGEGQIPFIYEHEVEHLKSQLANIYGDPSKVAMAYIIVTKRLSTRLFLNGANPPAGTVVDDVITNPLKYDFFLVSQSITQGSVSPVGYSIISDNVNLDAAKLQALTFKLTHMYFNWSGTVKVPAPCQFAHKLAFLVSQSIHASPSNHLETLLYFL